MIKNDIFLIKESLVERKTKPKYVPIIKLFEIIIIDKISNLF